MGIEDIIGGLVGGDAIDKVKDVVGLGGKDDAKSDDKQDANKQDDYKSGGIVDTVENALGIDVPDAIEKMLDKK